MCFRGKSRKVLNGLSALGPPRDLSVNHSTGGCHQDGLVLFCLHTLCSHFYTFTLPVPNFMGVSSLSFLRPLRKISESFSKVASGTNRMGKDAVSDQEEEMFHRDEVEGATAA